MFEEKEEYILRRMMNKVPNDLDKRIGSSLIYNALAPTAQEISKLRSDMDRFLKYGFANADIPDELLDLRCREHGIFRKEANYSIKLGIFTDTENKPMDIPLNSRFSIDKINYKAIEKIDVGKYKMECETIGDIGNYPSGAILPIEYIEKLGSATITDIILEGVDIEDNLSLFNRLLIKVQKPATSGNKYEYLNWTLKVQGVGNAIIKSLWDGPGTVKVLVMDLSYRTPTDELILNVANYIAEQRPIGATVTVAGVDEGNIIINTSLIIEDGYSIEDINATIKANINKYFKEIIEDMVKRYLKLRDLQPAVIRYHRVVACVLDIPGVVDYESITLNNSEANITLGEDSIPILESVVVTVAT